MSDITKSVLAQYEKNKAASGGQNKFSNQEDRMKKYFTTILPKGETTMEKRIRILSTKDGSTPFKEVKFHEIQVDGNWVKLYDPAQDENRSPLNEVKEALEATGKEADKELSKTYRSKKFYIVKLIDREKEQDGPKFWRFKHNSKGDGVMDKIAPIFRTKGDITDSENGRDLILTLSLSKSNNGKAYTVVSSIIPDDKSPLHEDPAKVKEWLDDELVWSDVYSKKSEEYLEMVANGEVPQWDKENKKWISKTTGEVTVGGGTPAQTDEPEIEDPQADNAEPDEDLPF